MGVVELDGFCIEKSFVTFVLFKSQELWQATYPLRIVKGATSIDFGCAVFSR